MYKDTPQVQSSSSTGVTLINKILPWVLLILSLYPFRWFLMLFSYPRIEVVGWTDIVGLLLLEYIYFGIISATGIIFYLSAVTTFNRNRKSSNYLDKIGFVAALLVPIYLVVGQNYNTWTYNSIKDENNKMSNSEKKQLAENLVDAYVRYKTDHGVYPKDYGGSMDDFIIPAYYRPDNFKYSLPLAVSPRPWYNLDPIDYGRTRICYYPDLQNRDYMNKQCIKLPN